MSSLYSQFLQLGYRISMYTILLRLSTVLLITHNSALKNFTKQARRSLKLKRKKIFAEVLQHAIAAAAALDSSCSQSHHAIIKSLLSLSTATTYIHTRCLMVSTNKADPSCFYFRISWILMERRWFYFFRPLHLLQGLRSNNIK